MTFHNAYLSAPPGAARLRRMDARIRASLIAGRDANGGADEVGCRVDIYRGYIVTAELSINVGRARPFKRPAARPAENDAR